MAKTDPLYNSDFVKAHIRDFKKRKEEGNAESMIEELRKK